MPGAPRSKQFDDVYFSPLDGLAETRHVFLDSNNLPENWQGRQDFTIFETGFGTGLNFLATAKLFADTSLGHLHFISVEKFPLKKPEIENALVHWKDEFANLWDLFLAAYPSNLTGTQTVNITDFIRLTLIFDDMNDAMNQVNEKIDCWFLDGFKPATNPDMWTETLFQNMARLSKCGATFATFTAVGFVKRGLQAAGFEVNRVRGFGTKWHMLSGCFP
ncbi:MAG: tRNA (5-methylaminomethyl-2-thiouridine)(34)-methyltransferase MnmD [Alphaproteobacteria bacterium]